MEYTNLQLSRTWQYAVYFSIFLALIILIIIFIPSLDVYFRRFFGEINAILVFVLISIAGAAALWFLQSNYKFVLFMGKGTLRGMALSAIFATLMAVAIVVADFIIRYPQDMNAPLPQALLFYPTIGFVAEIIFHLIPLALLLPILNLLGGRLGDERVIWIGILLAAAVEPTFQVVFMGEPLTWGAAYTWIHVFIISLLQLYVFRRFDFVSMYSFRLFYYAYWHILWGVIRLKVLF